MSSSKIDDAVDARERRENFGALGLRRDRPARSLVGAHRSIGVDADDQRVAERPRLLQIADMAGVQQIEDAVGEHDRSCRPQPRSALDDAAERASGDV